MNELKANYKRKHIIFERNFHIQKQRVIFSNYTKKFDYNCRILEHNNYKIHIVISNSIKYINQNTIDIKYFNFEITNNLKCCYKNSNNKIKFEFFVERNSLRKKHCYNNILHLIYYNFLLFSNRNKYFRNIFLLENICNFSIYRDIYYKYYNETINKINICSNKKIIIFKNSHTTRFARCLYDVKNLAILRNIYDICFNVDGNQNIYASCNVYAIRNEIDNIFVAIINKPLTVNTLQINNTKFNNLKNNLICVTKLTIKNYESQTTTKTIKTIIFGNK